MTIGSFCLIKNEGMWIKEHLRVWLPILDQMVFFDGGSTDGTLEAIQEAKKEYWDKIKLFTEKDPKDLKDDYQRLSNEAMWTLDTDMAIFLHPDMMYEKGKFDMSEGCIAATIGIKSYAGDPGGIILEMSGRGERWKNIYRLRNPDLGAHYHGHYGAANEDTYFSEITGDSHEFYDKDFLRYLYDVEHTSIVVRHYSDVRPYERRLDRMVKCLIHQGHAGDIAEMAKAHPRVVLKDGSGFSFKAIETPKFMQEG